MSDLIGFEPPKIDWTPGPDLTQRLKRFRQKCELLFEGPLKARTNEQWCKYLPLWTGDYGLDLYNTWNLNADHTKDINEYWQRFEEHVKPQSNHLLNRFYLRALNQNSRPLDDFLTEAGLLIQNSGYPADLHDELMRDALVFGVDSEVVRKKCIAEGNALTFQKAREIARTEEATRMQLEAMAVTSQIHSLRTRDSDKEKTPPKFHRKQWQKGNEKSGNNICGRCGGGPHKHPQKCPALSSKCHGCQKTGHYEHMCFTKKAF